MFWEFAKKLCKSKWCGHGESISHSWDEINYEGAFNFYVQALTNTRYVFPDVHFERKGAYEIARNQDKNAPP